MDSVPTALPTSKALPGRALASRVFDRGIFDEVLKRDPWHQPDVVCVFEERCEMRLVANPAPSFVVEGRFVFAIVRRLRRLCPRGPLTSGREQLGATV